MTVSPMARRRPVQRGTDRPGLDGEAHNRGRHRCEWSSSCPPNPSPPAAAALLLPSQPTPACRCPCRCPTSLDAPLGTQSAA